MPFVQRGANLLQDWLREFVRFRDIGVYSRILRHFGIVGAKGASSAMGAIGAIAALVAPIAPFAPLAPSVSHPVNDVVHTQLIRAAGDVHRKPLVRGPLPVLRDVAVVI